MKEKILEHLDLSTKLVLYDEPFWHKAVIDHLSGNFDRALRSFTAKPREFRDIMRQHGAIITGDFALWYIQQLPAECGPQTVELVVPIGEFTAVVEYFQEGDTGKGSVGVAPERLRKLDERGYGCAVEIPYGTRTIVVYQARGDDAHTTILFHVGTHLMNALTADLLLVLYPGTTMKGYSVYATASEYEYMAENIDAYRKYGIQGVQSGAELEDMKDGCRGSVLCGKTDRRIGDEETMIVQVGRGERRAEWKAVRGCETVWGLGGRECGNTDCFLPMGRRVGIKEKDGGRA